MSKKFYASHEINQPLAEEIEELAKSKNIIVVHNKSSFNKFDGCHRYIMLKANATNFTVRSKDMIDYIESRFSKMGLPSIRNEKLSLQYLKQELEKM